MAGSLGNVVNVSRALEHMPGDGLRFFILNTHYRSPDRFGRLGPGEPGFAPARRMVAARRATTRSSAFAERVKRITGKLSDLGPGDAGRPGDAEPAVRLCAASSASTWTTTSTPAAPRRAVRVGHGAEPRGRPGQAGRPDEGGPARSDFRDGAAVVREIADVLGLSFAAAEKGLGGSDALVAGLMQLFIDLRNNLRAAKGIADKADPTKKALFDQTDLIRNGSPTSA